MATGKLYDKHPYETEFTAVVEQVKKGEDPGCWEVVLDQTLFFPEEGGQSPDQGEIVIQDIAYEVVYVSISDEVITHTIRGKNEPMPGQKVLGRIDWGHRFSNMQNHTGEHIFSGIVHRAKGYDNVGFHLSDRVVTMDYNGVLTRGEIEEFTRQANRIIAEDLPVICEYPSEEALEAMEYRSKKEIEGAVRIVTIPGVDVCACCAPHVRSTAQVGLLMVVGDQSYKGGTRLSILCGLRAVADYQKKQGILSLTGRNLSTNWENIPETVDKLRSERDNLRYQLSSLSAELLEISARKLPEGENACLFTDCSDRNVLIRTLNGMKQEHPGIAVIFAAKDGVTEKEKVSFSYVAASLTGDSRRFSEQLKEKFGARGGGKPEMVQGSVAAKQEELAEYVQKFVINE